MKKAFTLLELLISITLFMIIVVFLYKTLDQTKHSNNLFSNKQEILKQSNYLHNIFLEDIAEASNITINYDKNKNAIVKIVTNNSYHNSFFNNVTYIVGATNKLVRIESSQVFNELKPNEENFYENAFIDILLDDIEYFELKNDADNYVFSLKQKDKNRIFYNTFKSLSIK